MTTCLWICGGDNMSDMNTLIFLIGCATTIVVVIVGTLCLRSDMRAMEARLRAAMRGVGADARAMESSVAGRYGSVAGRELRADMRAIESRCMAALGELRADLRAFDDHQRSVASDLSFIKGALSQRMHSQLRAVRSERPETAGEESAGHGSGSAGRVAGD